MQPVAIFRHAPIEGPGYFAIFLEQQGIPWQLIAVDAGEAIPESVDGYSGFCFMGGPMSVNDPLPWIDSSCALIRAAVAKNIPVIGHCLGGQLMSKAMGGAITRNPVKEIGWNEVTAEESAIAQHWLREFAEKAQTVFQWHGETFSIPPGATRLLANRYCANQMFALGPHLGMQCHVEMTLPIIQVWEDAGRAEIAGSDSPTVQSAATMVAQSGFRLPVMTRVAERLYNRWIGGLAGPR